MGKGKRNSLKRERDFENNTDAILERQKSKEKKNSFDKSVAIVCVILAIIIAGVLVVTALNEAGVFLRGKTAVEVEDVEVDATMMSFFLNDYILKWYNENSSMLAYYSIDLSSDLRSQTYGKGYETYFLGEYTGTWFGYFRDTVLKQVESYVVYAKAAKDAGMSLDAEDKADIDELLAGIKSNLKAVGAGYGDWYGRGVKKSDIRKCYELVFLADKYAEYKVDELESALEKDDSAALKYVENNKSEFYSADYLSFVIDLSSKNYENDAAYDEAVAAAKAEAAKIAEAKTPADFFTLVDAYKAANKTSKDDSTETETETETDSNVSIEDKIEDRIEEEKKSISYITSSDLGKWIFEENAKVNDVKVIEETGTETETAEKETGTEAEESEPATYDTFKTTVYFLVKESSLDKSLTKDYAYLATNDKAAIEDFLATFKAGETNKENFVKIAEEKYNAIHEDEDHEHSGDEIFEYNSFEKMTDGAFNKNYDVMNRWLDSGKLEDNTISEIMEIVVDEKTYYAVIYFEQYNDEAWYAKAIDSTVGEQLEAWYKEKAEAVVVSDDVIDDINTVVFYSSTTNHDH